jgi:hypothetical protein
LRALRSDINVFVLNCDTGVGVVTKGHAEQQLSHSQTDIETMDYSALAANRNELLGLRPAEYLQEFLHNHAQRA